MANGTPWWLSKVSSVRSDIWWTCPTSCVVAVSITVSWCNIQHDRARQLTELSLWYIYVCRILSLPVWSTDYFYIEHVWSMMDKQLGLIQMWTCYSSNWHEIIQTTNQSICSSMLNWILPVFYPEKQQCDWYTCFLDENIVAFWLIQYPKYLYKSY